MSTNPATDDEVSTAMTVTEGDEYRDVLNGDTVAVTAVNDGIATVTDGDSEWQERTDTIISKIQRGDFEPRAGFTQAADIPMPDDAQLLYPSAGQAEAAADRLGLDGEVHAHDLDGDRWYMPGESHDAFKDAMAQAGERLDDCVESVMADNPDLSESEAYAICNDQLDSEGDTAEADATDTKAEFSEGAAVQWSWQGEPVHGRVARVQDEATIGGTTITGDGDESVYVIDEYDDSVGAYRRANVAKPESSLNESQRDLPPRDDSNYVDSEAWADLTAAVSQSAFTPLELDHIAQTHGDILTKARPGEWLLHDADPVVYRADIPDKYLDEYDESLFVPNDGVADAARKVESWEDEHGDEVAGGASDGEGSRRATQLIEYADRGEPLAIEYWEEILNFHERHRAQDNHELDSEYEGEPWRDAGYVSNLNWGGDPGYEQAQRVMAAVESVDQELELEMKGAVTAEQSLSPQTITKADSNEVDVDALEGELREAVEADEYYIYGKASIEQWDDDDPPTYIQMDALEAALDRYFDSDTAPGIISRHHQDIPVGRPVREFEFESDTTLEIDGDSYHFDAGDTATSHVEDADGDGRPELWLAATIDNETEMGKKTRVLAAQGDLNGFSVTVHRNRDEMTQEGRVVTDCDLHAVTIGTDDQIKNKGSEFDVASVSSKLKRVADTVRSLVT